MSQNSTLATLPQNGGIQLDRLDFDEEKLLVIRDQICKGGTPAEFAMFIEVARTRGLNPFAKQIYFIKYGNQAAAFVVSIDALRLIADRTKCYAPGRKADYEYDQSNQLVSATSYVKKWVAGQWMEVSEEAYYEEFCQKSNGKPTGKWATMPRVMLAKCAEARALRKAFPEETSSLYVQEEMDQAQNAIHVEATEVSGPPVGRQSVKPAATNEPIVFRTKTHEGKRPDELTTKELEKYIAHWNSGEAKVRPQLRAAVEVVLANRRLITSLSMAAKEAGLSMADEHKAGRIEAFNAWMENTFVDQDQVDTTPIDSFSDLQNRPTIVRRAVISIKDKSLYWPPSPAVEPETIEGEVIEEAETEVVAEVDSEPDDDPSIFDSED